MPGGGRQNKRASVCLVEPGPKFLLVRIRMSVSVTSRALKLTHHDTGVESFNEGVGGEAKTGAGIDVVVDSVYLR